MGDTAVPGTPRPAAAATKLEPGFAKWSRDFLGHLAQTSNVAASARKARISTGTAYEAKRNNPEFNRAWRQSLCDGYELLELELLHRLRTGQKKSPDGKTPTHVYDNGIAFRLLVAHRGEAAKQRAIRDNEDADAILASIDAKLDRMRQAQLAASTAGSGALDEYGDDAFDDEI